MLAKCEQVALPEHHIILGCFAVECSREGLAAIYRDIGNAMMGCSGNVHADLAANEAEGETTTGIVRIVVVIVEASGFDADIPGAAIVELEIAAASNAVVDGEEGRQADNSVGRRRHSVCAVIVGRFGAEPVFARVLGGKGGRVGCGSVFADQQVIGIKLNFADRAVEIGCFSHQDDCLAGLEYGVEGWPDHIDNWPVVVGCWRWAWCGWCAAFADAAIHNRVGPIRCIEDAEWIGNSHFETPVVQGVVGVVVGHVEVGLRVVTGAPFPGVEAKAVAIGFLNDQFVGNFVAFGAVVIPHIAKFADHKGQTQGGGFGKFGHHTLVAPAPFIGPVGVNVEDQVVIGVNGEQIRPGGLQHIDILPPAGSINDQRRADAFLTHTADHVSVGGLEIFLTHHIAGFIADVDEQVLFMLLDDRDDIGAQPVFQGNGELRPIAGGVPHAHHGDQAVVYGPLNHDIQLRRVSRGQPDDAHRVGPGLGNFGEAVAIDVGPDDHFVDAAQQHSFAAVIIHIGSDHTQTGQFGHWGDCWAKRGRAGIGRRWHIAFEADVILHEGAHIAVEDVNGVNAFIGCQASAAAERIEVNANGVITRFQGVVRRLHPIGPSAGLEGDKDGARDGDMQVKFEGGVGRKIKRRAGLDGEKATVGVIASAKIGHGVDL